jgi:hypothetical protein
MSSLSACTLKTPSLDQPIPLHIPCVSVPAPKPSVLARSLVDAWKDVLPAPPNDDHSASKTAVSAAPCLDEVASTNHEWSDNGASVTIAPPHRDHELNFAGTRDNLLRAFSRILTENTFSKPLTTLYDPGYSGEILLSERMARRLHLTLEPVNQPIILADGSTVACSGVARGVTFAPTTTFCEVVDVLVFPLSNYDVLVGMNWLEAHDADISCKTKDIHFWPRNCSLRTDPNCHVVPCASASHVDTASVVNESSLHMLTCNQFKKFLREEHEVERCAVFFSRTHDDDALPLFSVEEDLSKAQAKTHLALTTEALQARADLPPHVRNAFCDMLATFETTVFENRPYSDLNAALNRDVQHEINELPHTEKPCRPVYRLSPPMMDELRAQVKALLAAGIIRPSMSPYGAPVLFARKKDGTWRMCIDYRALNKITIKDKFPLPRAEDLFDQVQGAKYFTKIDLRWGYYQIKVRPEDVHKTAFRTPMGSFEWLCMPFGLTNAPATFQRFVQDILQAFLGEFACVYIDDILVYSHTPDEHVEHVRQVLEVLQKHNLLAQPTKCDWFVTDVEYLGHKISGQGIAVDDEKVKVLREWPVPTCKADVRSFLGLANYYRRFIPHFAHITACLNELVHDKIPEIVPWDHRHQHAFDTLKHALTNAPVLRTYDRDLTCTVVADASSSHGAIGAALMQDDGHGPRPIAYFSRKMTSAERNYPTRDQELLAIRDALHQWKHYLLGVSFVIHSDHESLKYLFTQKELTGRLLRWCDFIQQFDFGDVKYLPGEKNSVGDALSRPPLGTRPAGALASLKVSAHEHRHEETLYNLEIAAPTSHLHDLMRDFTKVDPQLVDLVTQLQDPDFDPATSKFRNRLSFRDGLVYWHDNTHERIYVPVEMRKVLLKEAHDTPLMGHMGIDRTYNNLTRDYYWRGMHKDVCAYVNSCTTCQQNKSLNERAAGLARPLPVPDFPFETWGLDFIIMPPSKSGRNCVVVFVCHKSKTVHAIAATMTGDEDNPLSAKAVARIYFDHIVKHYGLCSALVSDRDRRFVSAFWQEIHKLCGTALHMSTAFRPQTDGLTERENRTVIQTLTCVLQDLGGDWEDHLTAVEFAMNNAINASTGVSPFFMTRGRHPRTPLTFDHASCNVPAAGEFLTRITSVLKRSEDSMLDAQMQQVEYMDKSRRVSPFKEGDEVWLSAKNIKFDTPAKFAPKYLGPYRILKLHAHGNAAQLALPDTFKARNIHDVFNVALLKRYVPRPSVLGPTRQNRPPPLAETAEGLFWEVDRVVQERIRRGRKQVLVRWKGYGQDEDSWLDYDTFKKECPEGVAEWEARRPPSRTKARSSK